ncbi:PTS sugar transporter subunit IIB [Spiroplasma endosymbiont of Crioceris asparagi]|uniref:PTS sugar transporter subunit IIB n=1 Tax=Spiroplasma endosymbiont of Crioceris asparagi TaxID=3066286 RepID=UPI0030CECFC8
MSKKILLVCSAGMSTSMLVKKMNNHCILNNLDYKIEAKGIAQAKPELQDWDVVLVGPQVSYAVKELKGLSTTPVELIPSNIYALGKGKDAVELAERVISDATK